MKSKLNKEWHLANPMPVKPSLEQRIGWHIEHVKHCSCRGIPAKIQAELVKRNQPISGIT